jgi:hypothetical protein
MAFVQFSNLGVQGIASSASMTLARFEQLLGFFDCCGLHTPFFRARYDHRGMKSY